MRLPALLLGVLAAATARGDDPHPADEDLGGPPSSYAEALRDLAVRRASPPEQALASAIDLTCVATPGDGKYVGLVQRMEIAASLREVDSVLADVAHYRELFPGLVDVHEVPGSRDGNRYVTAWEQRVPVFFIPNTRYELTYLVSRIAGERIVYRYRLARSGAVTNSDGIVVLEARGPNRTRFTEYDFFNARWGILPERAVWRESLRGSVASDLAIKLKAEHPAWSHRESASRAEGLRRQADGDVERCLRHRVAAGEVLAR